MTSSSNNGDSVTLSRTWRPIPTRTADSRNGIRRLRGQHITGESPESADVTVIGDSTGRLKQWFDTHPVGFVVIRPDRYVAAAALAQHAPSVAAALAAALHLTSPHLTSPHRRRSP